MLTWYNTLTAMPQKTPMSEYDYALNLAQSLRDKHYPEAGAWKPLPDLMGVLTQIDNMTSGLVREQHTKEGS